MNWQENLLTSTDQIRDLINHTKRIAVLGIKTDAQADQPSVYVPLYMQRAGFEIVPVPVYYPDATVILGQKVYRKLTDIPGVKVYSREFLDFVIHHGKTTEMQVATKFGIDKMLTGCVTVMGPPRAICSRKRGTTLPVEPSTLPKRTMTNSVWLPGCSA